MTFFLLRQRRIDAIWSSSYSTTTRQYHFIITTINSKDPNGARSGKCQTIFMVFGCRAVTSIYGQFWKIYGSIHVCYVGCPDGLFRGVYGVEVCVRVSSRISFFFRFWFFVVHLGQAGAYAKKCVTHCWLYVCRSRRKAIRTETHYGNCLFFIS